jgi:hypothetical protein
MVIWAGRIMVIQGVVHLVATGILSLRHIPAWLRGDLWLPRGGLTQLAPATGAYWLTVGSFGLPLLLLGGVLVSVGRLGRAAPAYVGWALGLWGIVGSLILAPSPLVTALVPAIMIIIAARRADRESAADLISAGTAG